MLNLGTEARVDNGVRGKFTFLTGKGRAGDPVR